MKTHHFFFISLLCVVFGMNARAQKQSLTVLNIDSQNLPFDAVEMGNMVRIEVDRLDLYDVMDKYDVAYMIDKHNLEIHNCYGKLCLVETGRMIGSQKMLGGSVERYGETIIITLRLIDVESASVEKTVVGEFLDLPHEMQSMVRITVREVFGLENSEEMLERLTREYNYGSAVTNPYVDRLKLSGPRMGGTYFTGKTASYLNEPRHTGGFDAYPVMFQFGYQFEAQYLNEGNYQALFEFIPMLTGLNQSMVIPSLTIVNGLRNNRNGWEFGIGPTLFLKQEAEGFFDNNNDWQLKDDWLAANPGVSPPDFSKRIDSRGDYALGSGVLIAVGKTFKSGRLNLPVNVYVVPGTDGFRYGFSFGFNATKN